MALYPQSFIEDVRTQADIVAVVQDTVALRKAGVTYKGLCPFHGEKTPVVHGEPGPRVLLLLRLPGGRRRHQVRRTARQGGVWRGGSDARAAVQHPDSRRRASHGTRTATRNARCS